MNIAFFSTKKWVHDAFDEANSNSKFQLNYFEPKLNIQTVGMAKGHDAVCVFVHDIVDEDVIEQLAEMNIKIIALRCAGFNNVNLKKAAEKGLSVVRVPAYSPYAVAEHALGMILALNRKYHRAHNRVREGNFALDGLLGFDLHGKTIGVIGAGKIGQIFGRIMKGLNMRVLVFDKFVDESFASEGFEYVSLQSLYEQSDIISLHCPLLQDTFHIINDFSIKTMKRGVMIVNTSRGPLIDTNAVIQELKTGQIGSLGLDVYEEEDGLFFEDLSEEVIQDDTFVRLQSFPNVLITAHQAFFTKEAVDNIAQTTLRNIVEVSQGEACGNIVDYQQLGKQSS